MRVQYIQSSIWFHVWRRICRRRQRPDERGHAEAARPRARARDACRGHDGGLASSSGRALFQRQADVIAVLYNSNFAMERARDYLDKASAIYEQHSAPELQAQARDLEALIY